MGRVKHIETRCLWVQDLIGSGKLRVRKVPGETNVADMLTKYLPANKLMQLMGMMPSDFEQGRSHAIPELQGGER